MHCKFEKVSFSQFKKEVDYLNLGEDVLKNMYDNITLPERATRGSAGYDIRTPIAFSLAPGCRIKIPTGIRARIADGWWLACLPRSSYGFKWRMQLDNTIGVIDSDYYGADNEGHIMLSITNDSKEGAVMTVAQNAAIAQGILLPFGLAEVDSAKGTRTGGTGSTGL